MGAPKAPEPTPPKETAGAQTSANINTAIAQQLMNNVNQKTPFGALEFNQSGTHTVTGPDGETHEVPLFDAVQTLSPEQQALYDSQTQAGQNLAELAVNQTSRLDDLLSKPMDLGGLPDRAFYSDIRDPNMREYGSTPSLASMLLGAGKTQDSVNRGDIQSGLDTSQDYTRGVSTPGLKSTVQATGSQNGTLAPSGQIQMDAQMGRVGGLGQVSASPGASSYQRSLGDTGRAQSLSDLLGIRDINTPSPITFSAPQFGNINPMGQAGDIQSQIGDVAGVDSNIGKTSSNILDSFGSTAGGIQYSYGGDFADQRDEVQQALFDRMQPLMDRDLGQLEARLASQGLRLGSEGYQDAMYDRSRAVNDARLGAILSAGQEQTRLVNMERDRAVFNNNAQQQDYIQKFQRAQFNNQAQAQEFAQKATAKQTELQAQAQEFAMLAQRMQATNAAQAQQYSQMADQFSREAQVQGQLGSQALQALQLDLQSQTTNANLGLQAQGMGVDRDIASGNMALSRGQFNNDAQRQIFEQALASGQFSNEAEARAFADRLASASLSSDNERFNINTDLQAQLANQDAGLREGAFRNDAQALQFGQNLTAGQFENAASTQALMNELAAGGFTNDALSTMFGQRLTNANLANDATDRDFARQLSAGTFGNSAQAQDFAQGLSLAELLNGTQQQNFDQLLAGTGVMQQDINNQRSAVDQANAVRGDQYNRDVASDVRQVDQQNAMRSAALQELLAGRNQPINEIAALLSGGQLQTPNFITPNTAQIAGTDIAGITQGYDAQRQANYQAQMASRNALLSNLFGMFNPISLF